MAESSTQHVTAVLPPVAVPQHGRVACGTTADAALRDVTDVPEPVAALRTAFEARRLIVPLPPAYWWAENDVAAAYRAGYRRGWLRNPPGELDWTREHYPHIAAAIGAGYAAGSAA